MFTKGESSVYTRQIGLVNTRASAGKPVAITVLDQVPMSEDEKLKVVISKPAGLTLNGSEVSCGEPVTNDGFSALNLDGKGWGRAKATLRKEGEVSWDVVLNPGKGAKLVLEYEISVPIGEKVAQV